MELKLTESKLRQTIRSIIREEFIGESVNELMMARDVDSKMKELGISKIPISSQGERVLKGMVKEKFLDKVTNKERLIYFVESLGKEKFGYGSKGKPLSPLVDRFWNDITSDGIFFRGKMAAYQVAMNIKDMKANDEEIDSPYEMMKEYFKNFGMDYSRSRVFDSALRNLGEWVKRNKIEESVNEAKKYYTVVVMDDGRRLAVDNEDIPRLKSGKDVVGKSLKYAGQEEWVFPQFVKYIEESVNETVKRGKRYGDWTVTYYEPVQYDDYGAPNGGQIKITNQKNLDTITIQNDLALRGNKWFVSVNRRTIKDSNPEKVIMMAIKNWSNESVNEAKFDGN